MISDLLSRFEYNAAAELVKEVQFEEVEGIWSYSSIVRGAGVVALLLLLKQIVF